MEQREAQNVKREKQGIPALRMHQSWTDRPKLNRAEWDIFVGFTEFAAMCAGEPTPQALLAWFDLKEFGTADKEWMVPVYTRLSSVLREQAVEGEQ